MKSFLIILILLFTSCSSIETLKNSVNVVAEESKEVAKEAAPIKTNKTPLAWGAKTEWDKYLSDAVNAKQWPISIQKPCKKLVVKDCVMQLISIMAKYESNFKPETNYTEGFNDSKGKPVISRGLLQISQESANGYNCNIVKPEQLNDPKTNLFCAVQIIHRWAIRDNTLMGEPKKGCARYFSVCRASSKSNAKILSYLSQF